MILFLFNNLDPFICKKLGHFIFLAFEKLESRRFHIAANKVRIFLVIMAIIIIIIMDTGLAVISIIRLYDLDISA